MLKIVKTKTFPLQTLDKRIWDFVVLWMRIFNQNIMKIPDTKQDRRRFIKEHLFQYQDKFFYCRALDCDVKVTDKSIEETNGKTDCWVYQKRGMYRICNNRIYCHKIKIDNRLLRSISLSSVTDLYAKIIIFFNTE